MSAELAQELEQALGVRTERGWRNFCQTLHEPEALVVEVDSEAQAAAVVRRCAADGLSLRAVAGWRDVPHCSDGCCLSPLRRDGVEQRYNESFSWTEASCAEVMLRFSRRFQRIELPPRARARARAAAAATVCVSAGVQLDELVDALWQRGYSLPTGSIIPHVSAVGLAATGGHGTGRAQPSFAGLVQRLRLCDAEGAIRELAEGDAAFATARGAHLGLFGVVLAVELRCVPRFWLREARHPLGLESLIAELPRLIADSEYLTLSSIPTWPVWDVRVWERTERPKRRGRGAERARDLRAAHAELRQHFEVESGAALLNAIADPQLHRLIGGFLQLVGRTNIASKPEVRVDEERRIAHYQVGFPIEIEECSILFPVARPAPDAPYDVRALAAAMRSMAAWTEEAAARDEYPVTFAMYARFFRGTDGGLSSSSVEGADAGADHVVCALEATTHRDNPHWPAFRERFVQLTRDGTLPSAKFHLGKHVPPDRTVADLYPPATQLALRQHLSAWHGSWEAFADGPFLNAWLRRFLAPLAPPL